MNKLKNYDKAHAYSRDVTESEGYCEYCEFALVSSYSCSFGLGK